MGLLRIAAIAFLATQAIHGADHARRGNDVVSTEVFIAGNILGLFALASVAIVFLRADWAARTAIAVGFATAAGFAVSHLLPYWSVFSDSFTHPEAGSGVTLFSWVTALLGIGAALLFGYAGIRALRPQPARA